MNAHTLHTMLGRRTFAPLTALLLFTLVGFCGIPYGAAQGPEKEGREVVDKIPKHLPIKVKVRKPEKLKDAGNEDWLDDIEIEVTNTGTKPIYYLSMRLDMPDVRNENGIMYALGYKIGRVTLADFGEPVRPDDVPLRPGETVTLNPPANHVEGWKGAREKGRVANPRKIEFVFGMINFGDGTGFAGTKGTPMPIKRQRSSNDPHTGGGGSAGQNRGRGRPAAEDFHGLVLRPKTHAAGKLLAGGFFKGGLYRRAQARTRHLLPDLAARMPVDETGRADLQPLRGDSAHAVPRMLRPFGRLLHD